MLHSQIMIAWLEVFPKSHIHSFNSSLSGTVFTKAYLQTKSEWSNGISENDTLSYMFVIDSNNNYSESRLSLMCKPLKSYMYGNSICLRKKSIKNIDYIKLVARFKQINQFIIDNTDNLHANYKESVLSKVL